MILHTTYSYYVITGVVPSDAPLALATGDILVVKINIQRGERGVATLCTLRSGDSTAVCSLEELDAFLKCVNTVELDMGITYNRQKFGKVCVGDIVAPTGGVGYSPWVVTEVRFDAPNTVVWAVKGALSSAFSESKLRVMHRVSDRIFGDGVLFFG